MTPARFKSIRHGTGLSQRAMARYLGIGFRTLQRYESGEYDIPRTLELLMTAIEAGSVSITG